MEADGDVSGNDIGSGRVDDVNREPHRDAGMSGCGWTSRRARRMTTALGGSMPVPSRVPRFLTNARNVTLTGLGASDPKVDPVICLDRPLPPGVSETCGPTFYVITAVEVSVGEILNHATAADTPRAGWTQPRVRTSRRPGSAPADSNRNRDRGAGSRWPALCVWRVVVQQETAQVAVTPCAATARSGRWSSRW